MNFSQDEISQLIGEQRLEIAYLARQLKQAQTRIAELEKKNGNADADKRTDAA